MKLVAVKFDDSVDISAIPKGATPVSISDGTNTIVGGTVAGVLDLIDADVVPHGHNAVVGLPTPPPPPAL